MERTTTPPTRKAVEEVEGIPLTEEEFEELLENRGEDLVNLTDVEGVEQILEVQEEEGEGKDVVPMPETPQMIYEAPMEKALSSEGITKEFLAQLLKEALQANKTITFFDQKKGEIIYSKDMVNWKVREEARKDVHKLLMHYPPEGRSEGIIPYGSQVGTKTGPSVRRVIREIEETIFGGEGSDVSVDVSE